MLLSDSNNLYYSYLAHGDSVLTVVNLFRIGLSTSYKIIAEVCPVLWEILSKKYFKKEFAWMENYFPVVSGQIGYAQLPWSSGRK